VPTQVVEIVRAGRAVGRKGELDLAARAAARDELVRPENRLIWTNDNIVALQTLLEARVPTRRGARGASRPGGGKISHACAAASREASQGRAWPRSPWRKMSGP